MGFKDCLLSAVEQGAISRQEADDLVRRFDEEFAQARLALGDEAAAGAAKAKLEKDLRAEGFEARRRVLLADAAQDRLAEYVAGYRGLDGKPDVFSAVLNTIENYGFAGTSSIAGRAKAIVSLAHGELADMLLAFRRSAITGRRFNKPLIDDVVREALGTPTNKPEARAFADALQSVFETLRQRFNAAGGAIGKIDGGYLPQAHDARALLKAGRDTWKGFIRPLLDLDRMRDPLTGDKLTPARLDQVLNASFDAVTTDGWTRREPQAVPFGRGALASQRAEHRFLHFKSADAWLAYNAEFGKGDPLKAMFEHVNGMARDIAAMETLGPNPNATMEWLKQIVQTEAAKAVAGRPSLYAGDGLKAQTAIRYAPWRIDAVYGYVRGRHVISNQVATGFGTVRNLITSAVLGSASLLAASTDPFIDMAARRLTGLPVTKALFGIVNALPGLAGFTREKAVRSGLVLDDFLHILGDEARYAGTLSGSEWSKWLADRTMNLSGLEPMTQARRHVFGLDFQAAIADVADTAFDDLPLYLKRTMQGYGLDRTAWDVIRTTPAHAPDGGAGFIRPIDIANLADGPALAGVQKKLGIDSADAATATEQTRAGVRRVAEQYLEMILGQTERAVPTGTAAARSFVTGGQPKGTVFGELIESGLLFKNFALSFTTLQLQAIQQELHQGPARGAAYASALAIGLTLGGGLALQLKNMANGKDPQPMDDPRFWLQAVQTGGGWGLLGDFMFADLNRFGHSLGQQLMGPTVGLVGDVAGLTIGNAQQLLQGKPTRAGREAVNMARRYTPVASSLWPTRAAYQRMVLDQLQYLADPEAARSWREQQGRLRRETGQEFYWQPGATLPDRAPQLPR